MSLTNSASSSDGPLRDDATDEVTESRPEERIDDEAVRSFTPMGRRGLVVALLAAIGVVAVDQTTKAIAVDRLTIGNPIHVLGTLEWELVYNRGSAFGMGQGLGPIIAVFALVVSLVMFHFAQNAAKPSYAAVFGVVAGGAIGNVLDRIFRSGTCPVVPCDGFLRGAVIDFIDLNWWPVFNVADMAVVCGVLAIGIGSIFLEYRGDH